MGGGERKEDEAAGVPPPLPSRDYQSGQDMDLLTDKLTAVAASSEAVDSSSEEEEAKEDVSIAARQYNRTVSDEYNQNTSTIDFNKREAIIEEEAPAAPVDEDPVEQVENKIYAKDSSDEEEEEEKKRCMPKIPAMKRKRKYMLKTPVTMMIMIMPAER